MNKQDKFWELATAELNNEATGQEYDELQVLLKDTKNKKLYDEIRGLKEDISNVSDLSHFSKSTSWNKISKQLKNKTISLIWSITKYAAIIVFAFLAGYVVNNQLLKINTPVEFVEVKVPLGQMSEITLFDGTHVWLNSGTTIRCNSNFGKNSRQVTLDGEAFFDVEKSKVPFFVQLKNTEVEVHGTSFNVVSYQEDDYSEVTLVEGKVVMNNSGGALIAELVPSEQIVINDITKKATVNRVGTNFYVSWKEGKIVFEEEELSSISTKLERWYNVDIQFEDEVIGELDFSGTILKNKPFDQIISAFEILLPINIKYTHVPDGKDVVFISTKVKPMHKTK